MLILFARGSRVIVFTRFDSEDIHPEADAMIICRDESCLLPPVDCNVYEYTGDITSGVHYNPSFIAALRTAREPKARRVARPGGCVCV